MTANDNFYMSNLEYTESYIAFIDMLGFKDFLSNHSCSEIRRIFDLVIEKYECVNLYNLLGNNQKSTSVIHTKIISDSICLHVKAEHVFNLLHLIIVCKQLQQMFLDFEVPVLLRGGIVEGNIYADEISVYGPGLTKAYLLEQKDAKNPRIIITGETLSPLFDFIRGDANNLSGLMLVENVCKDADSYYIVDYLNGYGSKARLIDFIEKNLNSTIDYSVREKYLYLSNYLGNNAKFSKNEINNSFLFGKDGKIVSNDDIINSISKTIISSDDREGDLSSEKKRKEKTSKRAKANNCVVGQAVFHRDGKNADVKLDERQKKILDSLVNSAKKEDVDFNK